MNAAALRRDERGQVVVLFALLLPMLLALGAVVVSIGRLVHVRPPPPDEGGRRGLRRRRWPGDSPAVRTSMPRSRTQARMYVGSHTAADGTVGHERAQAAAERDRRRPDLHQPQAGREVERELPGVRLLEPARVPVCESKIRDVKVDAAGRRRLRSGRRPGPGCCSPTAKREGASQIEDDERPGDAGPPRTNAVSASPATISVDSVSGLLQPQSDRDRGRRSGHRSSLRRARSSGRRRTRQPTLSPRDLGVAVSVGRRVTTRAER